MTNANVHGAPPVVYALCGHRKKQERNTHEFIYTDLRNEGHGVSGGVSKVHVRNGLQWTWNVSTVLEIKEWAVRYLEKDTEVGEGAPTMSDGKEKVVSCLRES